MELSLFVRCVFFPLLPFNLNITSRIALPMMQSSSKVILKKILNSNQFWKNIIWKYFIDFHRIDVTVYSSRELLHRLTLKYTTPVDSTAKFLCSLLPIFLCGWFQTVLYAFVRERILFFFYFLLFIAKVNQSHTDLFFTFNKHIISTEKGQSKEKLLTTQKKK